MGVVRLGTEIGKKLTQNIFHVNNRIDLTRYKCTKTNCNKKWTKHFYVVISMIYD